MTIYQKLKVAAILLTFTLSVPSAAFAVGVPEAVRDLREARQEVRAELKEEKKSMFENLREKTGNMIQGLMNAGRAVILSGKVTAKTDTTLTVEKDGKSYTVNMQNNTQLRRRFWGKSDMDEFAVGNTVNVYGTWTDENKTAINARMIRNLSIRKRFGIFFGEVKSLLSNGWVMSSVIAKRGDQTVTVSSSTQFENRKEESITQSDIQVGHRVRVKGLWDSSNNTVTEVTKVKDFNLPVRVSATVTVAATSTPSPTPTATPTP